MTRSRKREPRWLLWRNEAPDVLDYIVHLRTDRWRRAEQRILRSQPDCWACGERSEYAHHLDGARIGEEGPWDVAAFCEGCHLVMVKAFTASPGDWQQIREIAWGLRAEFGDRQQPPWPRTRFQRWRWTRKIKGTRKMRKNKTKPDICEGS